MDSLEYYVLCNERSLPAAEKFLDYFLPDRKTISDEFPFPEFVDSPTIVFKNVRDLIRRLVKEPDESYSIYWEPYDQSNNRQAMLFFTTDGQLIAGVADANKNPGKFLKEIADQVGGRFGYFTLDSNPPESAAEFKQLCRNSTENSLIDGIPTSSS